MIEFKVNANPYNFIMYMRGDFDRYTFVTSCRIIFST